jgi:hypothetical protein
MERSLSAVPHRQEVTLGLRADLVFLPLATAFSEKAAMAFGLGEPEALALTLATEEVFSYLCAAAAPGGEVQIRCRRGGYYVEQEMVFAARGFDMRAFNVTASAALDEQAGMHETGLLIASRIVDRFQFFKEDQALRLVLVKEKSYPSLSELAVPEAKPLDKFFVRPPDPEELKIFVRRVNDQYPAHNLPLSFGLPGKVVDMTACGEYFGAIAADKTGRVGGGIIWRWVGAKLVEFYGPYLFDQPSQSGMARSVVDACLGSIARTGAIGLINRYPTPELPREYFECLGSLILRTKTGDSVDMPAYYRHLEEDLGLSVWAHPALEPFLSSEYRRLFFAREIKPVRDEGEFSSDFSVLSAEFDRGAGRVTLHPVWWGNDASETLAAHAETLRREELPNIFFEMDVGLPWHCHFTPGLFSSGFEPRLVLPYAGKGDLVIFQLKTGEVSS